MWYDCTFKKQCTVSVTLTIDIWRSSYWPYTQTHIRTHTDTHTQTDRQTGWKQYLATPSGGEVTTELVILLVCAYVCDSVLYGTCYSTSYRCQIEEMPATSQNCSVPCPRNCIFSAFTDWSSCPVTCRKGNASRVIYLRNVRGNATLNVLDFK